MSRKKLPPPADALARWLFDFKNGYTVKLFQSELETGHGWHVSYGRLKRLLCGETRPTPEECKQIRRIREEARTKGIDDPSVRAEEALLDRQLDRQLAAEERARRRKRRPKRAKRKSVQAVIAKAKAIKKELQASGRWDAGAWERLRKKMDWSVKTMQSRLGCSPVLRSR